ncbi:MAG: TonB-dependent receptor plug domain-containing protein, partial [Betaproteobacteria bacterium]
MNKGQLYLLVGLVSNGCAHAQQMAELAIDEIVVTASRFDEKPGELPLGVKVISADDIRKSGETSLPRLLARQPGVFVRDNSGSPDMQVDLRGFGVTGDQNTLVLVDGRRLSEYELVPARWSSIPLDSIDRIEIVRGSGAVLYGGGSTGGVINILTKDPDRADKSFSVFAGGGSYDTRDYRIGGQISSDTIGLGLHGGHLGSDNYRENNRIEQDNFVADLRNFDPDRSVNLKLGYDQQDLRLPGNRTEAELDTDRRGTRTPGDFSNRRSGFANLATKFRTDDADLVMDVGYREKHDDFHAAFSGLTLDGETKVSTWRFSPRLKAPYSVFGVRNSLVFGFDWEDWDYESQRTNPAAATAKQRNTAAYLQNVVTPLEGTSLSI